MSPRDRPRHRLADLVVQFAGDAAPLVLLRQRHAAKQVQPLCLSLLAPGDVGDHAVQDGMGWPGPASSDRPVSRTQPGVPALPAMWNSPSRSAPCRMQRSTAFANDAGLVRVAMADGIASAQRNGPAPALPGATPSSARLRAEASNVSASIAQRQTPRSAASTASARPSSLARSDRVARSVSSARR